MKKIDAVIDGIHVILNVPESLHEFREGARLSKAGMLGNEGYLFEFGKRERLTFENSGVGHDLKLLFLGEAVSNSRVVEEEGMLYKMSGAHVTSDYVYATAVELPAAFCIANKIGKGSIITVSLEETDDEEDEEKDN